MRSEADAPKVPWTPDALLCLSLMILLCIGIVLVYSSSSVYAGRVFNDPQRFLRAQIIWTVVGAVAMAILAVIPRRILSQRCGWWLLAALVACGLVLIPGIGHFVGGARRWFVIGPFSCQPSEVTKLAVVVFLAGLLAKRRRSTGPQPRPGLLVPVLVVQLPVALILCEPDLGTAIVIELLMVMMLFAAGLRPRTLVLLALASMPVLYHLIVGTPFRLRRVLGYIDPWAYRSTVGYQVTEALISIGSGGLFGVGLGDGKQKLFFLPEAHTDFIFAILAEETGLVGVILLLGSFAVLLWRGMRLATRAGDPFDRYLALGLTALVGIPAVFNACVATGLLPTKGLPLPFVSYGGSNLVVTMAAMGLLLRIDRDLQRAQSGAHVAADDDHADDITAEAA
jgi:cell division protein FtsW